MSRWFGRRREETGPDQDLLEQPVPDEPISEPDWNAVVADSEETLPPVNWSDWSPPTAAPEGPDAGGTDEVQDRIEWSEWAAPAPSALNEAPWEPAVAEPATESSEPEEPAEEVTLAVWDTLADPPEAAPADTDGADVAPAPVEPVAEDAGTTDTASAPVEPVASPAGAGFASLNTPGEPSTQPAHTAAGAGTGFASLITPGPPPGAAASTSDSSPETAVGEEPRYRTTLSWPPPRKPRIGTGFLSLLVMVIMVALLITNGQFGRSDDESNENRELPALKTDPGAVPKDWIVYRNQSGGFGISYPPTWSVRDDGTVVRIVDPASKAELKIDQRRPPGKTKPEDNWLEQERAMSSRSAGYRRLQLSEASYQGHQAALWEYTFAEGTTAIHAADLEFVTKKDRFTLNFRGPVSEWQGLLPTFQGFLSSFKAPK